MGADERNRRESMTVPELLGKEPGTLDLKTYAVENDSDV